MAEKITTAELSSIVVGLATSPKKPVGRHLTTVKFALALSGASASEMQEIAFKHIESCLTCASEALLISRENDKIEQDQIADLGKSFNWQDAARTG